VHWIEAFDQVKNRRRKSTADYTDFTDLRKRDHPVARSAAVPLCNQCMVVENIFGDDPLIREIENLLDVAFSFAHRNRSLVTIGNLWSRYQQRRRLGKGNAE
jgi:hypothetical protein